MAWIDPEQERRRLIDFYSGQMDGELEKVAGQAYELTDLAREALRTELVRRGLSAELAQTAPDLTKADVTKPDVTKPDVTKPDVTKNVALENGFPGGAPMPPRSEVAFDGEGELRELVTIRTFRDLPEALLAKGSLESAGIEALLADDNIIRLDWFWSNLMGGIKLQVDQQDAEAANGILDQPIPEGFDVAGVGEYQQPRCPKCQSLDVSFQELDEPVAYVSAYFGVPVPWKRRAWRCHACNAEWEESDDQGTGESQTGEGQTGGDQTGESRRD
ncbi:MAG: hypothetical protein WBQ08_11955 [Candidatus Sulfotelmatobacter sp.]